MPARTRATLPEIHLLLKNVIEQAVFVKRCTRKQECQERWRLKVQKIESLQPLEFYDQWFLQMHHCYCRFHREHPPVPFYTAAETMEVDAGSLEKALEEAFLKVAQLELPDLPITNTTESWLKKQSDMVRRPESIASQSETACHISCAHHCSCRKEIVQHQSENQASTMNQEKRFSFSTMGRSFAISLPPFQGIDFQCPQILYPRATHFGFWPDYTHWRLCSHIH